MKCEIYSLNILRIYLLLSFSSMGILHPSTVYKVRNWHFLTHANVFLNCLSDLYPQLSMLFRVNHLVLAVEYLLLQEIL